MSKTMKGDLHQSNMRAIKMPYNTSTSTTTTETTLFNLLVNFEDNITESPLCKLQIPSWLNVWCVLISICLLIMIVGFVLMLSHIRYYRQRQLQFNRIPGKCTLVRMSTGSKEKFSISNM